MNPGDLDNHTFHEVGEILDAVENEEISSRMGRVSKLENRDFLRNSLSNFVVTQLNEVNKANVFLNKALQALEKKIDSGEADAKDILEMYKIVSSMQIGRTNSVFDPFKPQAGQSSPLLPPAPMEKEDSADIEKALAGMPPEELQLLDKVFRLTKQAMKEKPAEG